MEIQRFKNNKNDVIRCCFLCLFNSQNVQSVITASTGWCNVLNVNNVYSSNEYSQNNISMYYFPHFHYKYTEYNR